MCVVNVSVCVHVCVMCGCVACVSTCVCGMRVVCGVCVCVHVSLSVWYVYIHVGV